MAQKREGNCHICGNYRKLSFEHIPPEKAFNSYPIYKQDFYNLIDEQSPHFGKRQRLNQGFGAFTLCEDCNKKTGSGKDYIVWAQQGMSYAAQGKSRMQFNCNFTIKPLNVLKQVVSFFLSADNAGVYQANSDVVKFILNKESTFLPERYKVYLYLVIIR